MKVIKSIFIFILIILAVVIFLEVIPVAPEYEKENPWIIKKGEAPLIIPHGGAKLLYPESTIYSFKKLAEDGYDVFEVDLSLTSDNKLISHHDVTLERTTGENIRINNLKYSEIVDKFITSNFAEDYRTFDNNPISNLAEFEADIVPATLDYLFTEYSDKMYVLEIKDTIENSGEAVFKDSVNVLKTLITEYKMEDKVIVSSVDDKVTEYIRKATDNKIMTSTATNDTLKFVLYSFLRVDFFYRPKDAALIIPIKDDLSDSQRKMIEKVPSFIRSKLTTFENDTYYTDLVKQYIINDAHRHNMAVQYWTVNDEDDMKLLIKMGVDGIITDRPDLLLKVYDELGLID